MSVTVVAGGAVCALIAGDSPRPLPGRRTRREAGIEVGVLVGIGAAIGASTEAGAPGRTSVMR